LLKFDFELITVSSCLRIWLEIVRDHPVPDLAQIDFLVTTSVRGSAVRHDLIDRWDLANKMIVINQGGDDLRGKAAPFSEERLFFGRLG
jgi:hypothetical protein